MTLPGQKFYNGVSNFLFGSNFPPNYTTNTIENTAAIQQLVKQAGITLLRVAINDGAPDSEINARADACAACGCAMLVILPHNDLTFNSHMVSLLGSRCNLYELSNEPDLNSITWQQYLQYWNNQIPALRKLNPNAAFGGPALGVFSNVQSYLVPWLQGCKSSGVLPDYISFHEYPCYQISQSACAPKAPNIGNDGATLRTTVKNTLGVELPICCTEWNIDPSSNPPSYVTQSSFVTPFYHSALDSMVNNKLDMACQFDAGSGDSFRDLISTSTFKPQAGYQPMIDEIQKYLVTQPAANNLVGPDTPIGITQGTKDNSNINPSFLPDMVTMGLRWLRWQPYANAIEKSQGQYSWGNLDSVVKAANAAGVNIILTVLFPPSWGQSGGVPTPQWTYQFANAMCSHYDGNHGAGRIQGIELGNEDYGFPDAASALAATMNYCYPKLKASYPNLIIGPGCALHRNTSKVTSFFQTFLQQAGNNIGDYLNFHFYCQNNNQSDPSVDGGSNFVSYPHLLQILTTALKNAGKPGYAIWITETGWPLNTNFGYPAQYLVSQQQQWNYIKYVLDQSQALGQPFKVFLYCLSYLNQKPSAGIGTSQGMSLYQGIHGSGGFETTAFQQLINYPKNWGGGSGSSSGGGSGGGGGGGGGGSNGVSARNLSARARVQLGTGARIKDLMARARLGGAIVGTNNTHDLVARAGFVGGIIDTFQRSPAPSWGMASDGEAWTQAGGSATASIVTAAGQPIASDTFARSNQSGWGQASDGNTWTIKVGSGTLTISGNEGICVSTSADTDVQLGSAQASDMEVLCRMAINNYADICGVQARFTTSSGQPSCYKLLWYTTKLHINKAVAGVNTELINTSFGMDPGVFVWMRFRVQGTTLQGKAWHDGDPEPTNWMLTTTDSSVSGPGGVAVLANTASGSAGTAFDHFSGSPLQEAGQVTGATGTTTLRLGSQQLADAESAVRVSFTQPGDIIGLTLRDTSLNNFVRLRLTSSQVQLCEQTPSGGFVILSSYAFTPVGGIAYWLKFRALFTTLQGKIWADGNSEPDWLFSATTSVRGAGQVGLAVSLSQASDVALFDHYSTSVASQAPPPPVEIARDLMARAALQAPNTTPSLDLAARAGILDLETITVVVYAANRPPLQRTVAKS